MPNFPFHSEPESMRRMFGRLPGPTGHLLRLLLQVQRPSGSGQNVPRRKVPGKVVPGKNGPGRKGAHMCVYGKACHLDVSGEPGEQNVPAVVSLSYPVVRSKLVFG